MLRAKAAAPLEVGALPPNAVAVIAAYEAHRTVIADLSAALQAHNAQIAIVKERAAGANVATLTADLAKLSAIKSRHEAAIATLCEDYLAEKNAKTVTERLRVQARAALDQYRQKSSLPMRPRLTSIFNASMPDSGWEPLPR